MDTIDSVEELVKVLSKSEAKEFVKISERLKLEAADFKEFATWSGEAYTRNCISRDDHYELLLLCWEPHQITPIHCHNGEECWVLGLEGEFEEVRFDEKSPDQGELIEISREHLSEGGISYMNDNMGFHHIENLSAKRGMTLHLYMDPIDSCRVYDEDSKSFIRKKLSYDSVAELSTI